jgi:Domain of unknown function (DUF4271)
LLKYYILILLFFTASVDLYAQAPVVADTSIKTTMAPTYRLQALIDSNRFINTKATPITMPVVVKKHSSKALYFYLCCFLLLFVGITRAVFPRYLDVLFRVIFNTTLKQSQLTDQLMQSKLPSLLYNVLFSIVAGVYVFLLLQYYNLVFFENSMLSLLAIMLAISICYLAKYIGLLALGWVTNHAQEVKSYIFIVFLLNKALGLFLIPFTIVMAFSSKNIVAPLIIVSFVFIGLLYLIRFFRSYAILRHKLKLTGFHFFMFAIAIEVLPLLIICKTVSNYL